MAFTTAQHIILRVATAIFFAISACVLLGTIPPYTNLNDWKTTSNNAMRTATFSEQNSVLIQIGNDIQARYNKFILDVQTGTNYTLSALQHTIPVRQPYRTYFGDPTVDLSLPPPVDFEGNQKFSITWQLGISSMSDVLNISYVNETSLTDNINRALYKANVGLYSKMLIGIEKTGCLRRYPYGSVPLDYKTSTVYCNGSPVGYSPVCRPWYIQAVNNSVKGAVTFSGAYVDAATGLSIMSASQAIYFPDSTTLWGVYNIDTNMSSLDQFVSHSQVSENGYLFLMDSVGNILSHPAVNRVTWAASGVPLDVYHVEPNFPATLWSQILAQTTSAPLNVPLSVTKQQSIYNVNFLYLSQQKQFIVTVIPDQDVIAVGQALNNQLNSTVQANTVAIVATLVLLFFACSVLIVFITGKLTKPLRDVCLLLDNMTKQNYMIANHNVPASVEMQILYRSLNNVCKVVQIANDAYSKGGNQEALAQYKIAEELMSQCKNERGQAICWNNIGNVYKREKRPKEALQMYAKALSVAQRYLAKSEANLAAALAKQEENKSENVVKQLQDQLMADRITCGKRAMNEAVLYKDNGTMLGEALEMFQSSLKYHRDADDSAGIARVCGNLGQLYIERNHPGDKELAFQVLDEAYKRLKPSRPGEESIDPISLQYIKFNLALLAESNKDYVKAVQWVEEVLFEERQIEQVLQLTCLEKLASWYEKVGDFQACQSVTDQLESLNAKNVVFVLDISGSMAGGSIESARTGIKHVMNELRRSDHTTLITFHDQFKTVFALQNKANYERTKGVNQADYTVMLYDKIDNETDCHSGTNFYGALIHALNEMEQQQSQISAKHNWIVALTDGEDTRQQFLPEQVAARYRQQQTKLPVHLIVLTVGHISNTVAIDQIVRACGEGQGLRMQVDRHGIKEAFKRVKEMVITGQMNVESF